MEYNELRHLVERWVLHPPAAALEADTSHDELDERPPSRGAQPARGIAILDDEDFEVD